MSSTTTLVVGTDGDILIHAGPAQPAFFVSRARLHAAEDNNHQLPASCVITGQVSLLILGMLLPDVQDIRSIGILPKEIPEGTAAFRLKRTSRCTYAYVNSPEAVNLDRWASRNRIHCLITPVSCNFTSLAKKQAWYHECEFSREWELLHATLGRHEVATHDSVPERITINITPNTDHLP
jgi:hypothetical protein